MRSSVQSAATVAEPQPRPSHWVPDIVLAALIISVPFMPAPAPEFLPAQPVTWVLVCLPVLVLPVRRRWPLPVLAALLLIFGAAAFTGTLSPGIGIAVAAAMFEVATRVTRRDALIVGCGAVIAIAVMSLPVTEGNVFDARGLQFGLFVAFAAAAGDGARSRRAYVLAITERAERAEQTKDAEAERRVSEERLRIARDLHDRVAHQIAVISLNAGAATRVFETDPAKSKESLVIIRSAARTVLGEIGDLMNMLRADDEPDPEETAPQPGLDQLDALIAQFRAAGMDVTLRTEGDLVAVTGMVNLVAYRVLHEALTNAHKHGSRPSTEVELRVTDDDLVISVTNSIRQVPGCDDAPPGSGFGLIGLRERVTSVRGTIESGRAGDAWRTQARLPLTRPEL